MAGTHVVGKRARPPAISGNDNEGWHVITATCQVIVSRKRSADVLARLERTYREEEAVGGVLRKGAVGGGLDIRCTRDDVDDLGG